MKKYEKQNKATIALAKKLNIDNIEDKLFYTSYGRVTDREEKYDIKRISEKNAKTYIVYFFYDLCYDGVSEILRIFCCYNNEHKVAILLKGASDFIVSVERVEEFLEEYKNAIIKKKKELFYKYYPMENRLPIDNEEEFILVENNRDEDDDYTFEVKLDMI
ncbi:MAG: hypothetical protein ACTSSP_00745 [Candidatus Asgardarchaeia archaeon]